MASKEVPPLRLLAPGHGLAAAQVCSPWVTNGRLHTCSASSGQGMLSGIHSHQLCTQVAASCRPRCSLCISPASLATGFVFVLQQCIRHIAPTGSVEALPLQQLLGWCPWCIGGQGSLSRVLWQLVQCHWGSCGQNALSYPYIWVGLGNRGGEAAQTKSEIDTCTLTLFPASPSVWEVSTNNGAHQTSNLERVSAVPC